MWCLWQIAGENYSKEMEGEWGKRRISVRESVAFTSQLKCSICMNDVYQV